MIAPNYPRVDFELTADPGAAIGLIPPGGAEALDLPKMPPELPRWNSRQVQRSSTRTKQFGLSRDVYVSVDELRHRGSSGCRP